MKVFALLLSSVVGMVALSLAGSCSSNNSQTVIPVSQPSALPSPSSTTNESLPSLLKAEPYSSGDIKIVAVEIKEKNSVLRYELDVSYPQIDGPSTPQERNFNSYVQRMVENDVKEFKRFCSRNTKYPNGRARDMEYHMGTRYEVLYSMPRLLSINLKRETFTGYLNSDWYPIPLNYDLKAGRPLKNLAALFKPQSKFLKTIADYCVDELMRVGLSCGGGGVGGEQWLRRGAEPKADNYGGWNLTRNGLQINFGEYQIGPGCLGLVSVVVPYEHLKGMLREDLEGVLSARS
ncbi:MAG TPA: DUF3298 domain-containing protein [Pyrinomonadaceae bacterium]|nr:DUF3298 domain-containing protein [Pyrinomonadaceae bacterium]